MNTYSGRKRPQTILLVLLALAILLDRTLIASLFPWAPELAGVNPILVFLDIPVRLPVIFDLPVMGIFFFFYWILLLSYPTQYGAASWQESRKRIWRVFTGALAILLCLAVGGRIYYLTSGLMSREVRNGIESFGIQADIYTPIPDHELIHLRGGMILLGCLLIGIRIFIKRTAVAKEGMERVLEQAPVVPKSAGSAVDPSIAGFQEKRTMPRAAATSVPVVAPRPVKQSMYH